MELPDADRLRWQCRRGMLELDLLLEAFLDRIYPTLSDQEKHTFIRLLDTPDPDLNAWILGDNEPEDQELLDMLGKLRRTMS